MINDFIQRSFSMMANNIWPVVFESLWLSIPIGVIMMAIFALAGARLRDANIPHSRNASPLTAPFDKSPPRERFAPCPSRLPITQWSRESYISI